MTTWIKAHGKTVLLYVMLFLISCFILSKKVDYHVDELLTLNLSNAESWLKPETGKVYSPAGQPFVEAMASNGTFDLRHVWKQQAEDTHPPFYYVLVHLVCTFFPGTVSAAYSGAVNIFFLLLTFFFYRKILALLLDDPLIILALSLMFIFSAGILSATVFLRMYMMTMFWITVLSYVIVKNLDHLRPVNYLCLTALTIGGALTHYYFIVYAFFISLVLLLILIFRKRWKEALLYVISMGIAAVVSCLIFPAMIRHMFQTGRGAKAVETFTGSDLFGNISVFVKTLSRDVFGGILLPTAAFIVLILLFFLIRKKRADGTETLFQKNELCRYVSLLVPSLGYLIIIGKTAPYTSFRYLSPIYAVSLAGGMCLFFRCIRILPFKRRTAAALFMCIAAVMTILSLVNCKWKSLYPDRKSELAFAEEYAGNTHAICLYNKGMKNNPWKINPSYLEMSYCETSIFYPVTDYEEFAETASPDLFQDRIAFFLVGIKTKEFITAFLEDHSEYKLVKDNGYFGYGHSFYFERN